MTCKDLEAQPYIERVGDRQPAVLRRRELSWQTGLMRYEPNELRRYESVRRTYFDSPNGRWLAAADCCPE